jgi:hypothetical protein
MKKVLVISLALLMICFCSNAVFAIDLEDTNGGGPGATGIAVSANSAVSYSGAATAGGYANGGDGEVMAAVSASLKAAPKEALYFGVRSSMHPDDTDDNGVYQLSAWLYDEDAPDATKVEAFTTGTDFNADWALRGGKAGS